MTPTYVGACAIVRQREHPERVTSATRSDGESTPKPLQASVEAVCASSSVSHCASFGFSDSVNQARPVDEDAKESSGQEHSSPTTNSCAVGRLKARPVRCDQGYKTSNSPAAPIPPPTHMVTTTCRALRRLPSSNA